MAEQRVFTLSQVAQHKSKEDCWLVINGRVLNVTKFLEEHPGGHEVLIESAGKDASKDFEDIGHSKAAQKLLRKYQVGALQGFYFQEGDSNDASYKVSSNKQGKGMNAFVIKDNGSPKYAAFIEFFVPLFVATFFFGYRYLTTSSHITY